MTTPPTLLTVPGVGLWPALFEPVATELRRSTGWNVEIVTRPVDRLDFTAQTRFLADRCRQVGDAVLIGVSGGATLALACASASTAGLRAIVTHEPLVGPLEPRLHTRVANAGARLASAPGEAAGMEFMAELYGRGWQDAPAEADAWARARTDVICAEVARFASFHPTEEALRVRIPHLTTVGADSGPERHRVRDLLADNGAVTETIDGAGHLVLVDQPTGFVRAIERFLAHTRTDGADPPPPIDSPTPTDRHQEVPR